MTAYTPGGDLDGEPFPPQVEIPPANFKEAGKEIGKGVTDSGWADDFVNKLTLGLAKAFVKALTWTLPRLIHIIAYFAQVIVQTRSNIDDNIAELASLGVSDLFGESVDIAAFQNMGENPGRRKVAEFVGTQILSGVSGDLAGVESGAIVPTDAAAKSYMTRMANIAVEGWFEQVVMGMLSEHPLEKIGELGEVVTSTFGLPRLTRRVLSPLVDTVVVTPFEWKLNKDYRPKLLTGSTLVRQYARGRITRDQLNEELARQGYSDTRIEALINESSKFLNVSDLSFLEQLSMMDRATALQTLRDQGYPESLATTLLDVEKLKRVESAKQDLLNAAIAAYVRRDIDRDTFDRVIAPLGIEQDVLNFLRPAVGLRREFNVLKLSMSEAEAAVKQGFWTFRQFTDYLKDRGMSDADVLTKQLLLQDAISEIADQSSKRKKAEEERSKEKAQRLADAAARRAELELQRSRKDLTIAQVQTAYVRGRITADQYRDFLVGQKFTAPDVDLLTELADDDRANFLAAEQRRGFADQKLAATSLTSQQLQRSVELGDLTVEQWRGILAQQGIAEADLDLLQHQLAVTLQERADAEKRRQEVAMQLARKSLSLDQFERAVRAGLKTLSQYGAFLQAQGYGPEDVGVLTGLLQAVLDADTAARKKHEEIAASLQKKQISLPDLERAVRRGIRSIGDYRELLAASGLNTRDVDTLVSLLEASIAEDTDARARKAEIDAQLGVRRASLNEIARAVRLGLVPESTYRNALDREKVPADDQAILIALLETDIADAEAAKATRTAAELATQTKAVPLADVARAVRRGLRTVDEYKLAARRDGFDSDSVELMGALLQDEVDMLQAATARRAELDATKTKTELSRADLERAVKAGVRSEPDYRQYLVDHGYSLIDVITLERLLLSEMGD